MTVQQALAEAAAKGLDRLDSQLLLLHALDKAPAGRAWLVAHDTDALDEPVHANYLRLCDRRASGEPLAYIVGHKEFFGLDLQVDSRVLVPRPDTETLVEWALEVLAAGLPVLDPGSRQRIAGQARHDVLSVIDLGTGSGAIALAIKKNRPDARVEAVDSSAQALGVASANANALRLDVVFRQACWLAGNNARYHLIVSNPPYLAAGDPHLPTLAHEPLMALASGPDGLADLRKIVDQAPGRLLHGGWLLLEHGWDQAEMVRGLLAVAGFQQVASRRDLAGIARCSGGQWLELG